MNKVTMIGCDLHDVNMLLMVAVDGGEAVRKSMPTADVAGLIAWIQEFAAQHGSSRIVFAYEASGRGFGLHDALTEAGIECHVLAPTHLPRTVHGRKNKTDEKDSRMILDELRAHVLAGRKLPRVWVPDPQTRDDREPVRMRLTVAAQRTQVKNQIRTLAKRWQLEFPTWFTASGEWSKRSVGWLRDVASGKVAGLQEGARAALNTLVELHEAINVQMRQLDKAILRMAKSERYAKVFRKLQLLSGVGTLSAMTFLTELGDLERFANRRQLAAYLGLVPQAFESGNRNDRKGHITHQGSARVRHMLCQSAWAALRSSDKWRTTYDNIKRGMAKRSKIAIVAVMRRLAITMWQVARSKETEQLLAAVDAHKDLAQAQQKEAAPCRLAIASAQAG
jgi:transposase